MNTTTVPTLEEMLEAGVHFGHQTRKWNPKMNQFIFDAREGVHIINLEATYRQLQEALKFIKDKITPQTPVIVVGTKRQAAPVIKRIAVKKGLHYVINRWPGGLITNFENIRKPIQTYQELVEATSDTKQLEKLPTRRRYQLLKERDRHAKVYEGLVGLEHPPELLIVVDPRREQTAVQEARKKGIPTIGIVDTNTDPTLVDIPIPANDDALRSIELLLESLANAVVKAQQVPTK